MSGTSSGTKRTTKQNKAAMAALNQAAGTALEEHKDEITKCLLTNIKKGHAASAKLLVELAKASADETVTRRRKRSRATALGVEQEWSAKSGGL